MEKTRKMNKLEQLKSELKEKEKGCGTEIIDKVSCGDKLGTFVTQWLCPSCKAEISALKKGISACEERNKEILEIVDKLKIKHTKEHRGCGDPSECCFNRLDVLGWDFFEDLKKQLTEGEGKEWK
jgi:hypothetical protein